MRTWENDFDLIRGIREDILSGKGLMTPLEKLFSNPMAELDDLCEEAKKLEKKYKERGADELQGMEK